MIGEAHGNPTFFKETIRNRPPAKWTAVNGMLWAIESCRKCEIIAAGDSIKRQIVKFIPFFGDFVRHVLNDAGDVVSKSPNCGVRVVEGQDRAYVTDFIRDARAGGCAVGIPPDNLGFRLVRESRA